MPARTRFRKRRVPIQRGKLARMARRHPDVQRHRSPRTACLTDPQRQQDHQTSSASFQHKHAGSARSPGVQGHQYAPQARAAHRLRGLPDRPAYSTTFRSRARLPPGQGSFWDRGQKRFWKTHPAPGKTVHDVPDDRNKKKKSAGAAYQRLHH